MISVFGTKIIFINIMKLIITLKQFVFASVVAGLLIALGSNSVNAQMGMMGGTQEGAQEHGEALGEVLSELYAKYSVSSEKDLDCSKLTEDELEKLGEAVMGKVHPDTEVHEAMDEMMGGEGSASLKQAHINMGSNYLGCSYKGGGMGMMGGMMNGFGTQAGSGTGLMPMYAGYSGGLFGLNQAMSILVSISLIVFLLAGARWFWRKGGK